MPSGERIQKILSAAGIASRRKAERLIEEGRVTVNGKVITELGTRADPTHDHIKVDGKLVARFPRKRYVLLNKPRQVICTLSDPQNRRKVTDLVRSKERLYPVGRLDYATEGLILLTNDGEFARLVAAAGESIPKVYQVKVKSIPARETLERLSAGIRLRDGSVLGRCAIRPLRQGNNSWLEVTLRQGRNRQIRRMFEEAGHAVQKLRRVRIGFLNDAGLPPGHHRPLTENEVERFMRLARGRRAEGTHSPQGRTGSTGRAGNSR